MRAQIYFWVSMDNKFIIPLNGLAAGKTEFSWQTGKEFFELFENTEILDADLLVKVFVEKSGRYLGIDCEINGRLTVACDRCMEDLKMPVETEAMLSLKFGEEESSQEYREGEYQEGEREIVFVSQEEAEFDMSQIVYDYVCLALPMQRHHGEGECNPEAMRYLGGTDLLKSEEIDNDNPFAALKGLIK